MFHSTRPRPGGTSNQTSSRKTEIVLASITVKLIHQPGSWVTGVTSKVTEKLPKPSANTHTIG
jgi:hypothetical protein